MEPQIHPLRLELENVSLSPHIGSATGECRRDHALCLLNNVKHFIQTGHVLKPVL